MTTTIDNAVQNWINTSDNTFAASLRQQQQRGKVLSERQLAVAARIVADLAKPAPASTSKHVGSIGDTLVAEIAEAHEFISKAGKAYTKLITSTGDELVFFGRLSRVDTGALSFTVQDHSEWNGKRSTVISRPDWVVSVTDVELVDLSDANALLNAFRAAAPVVKAESKTPFADFAQQLRK